MFHQRLVSSCHHGETASCSSSAPLRSAYRPARGRRFVTPVKATISAASSHTTVERTISCELAGLHTPRIRFQHDNTSFFEEFRIRGNECGPDQHANMVTMANLLQEIGGNHGVALWGRAENGFASMPGVDHLLFVATRMQIRMEAYPKWGDLVRLETYFAEEGRLCTRREWNITHAITGQHLGAATSTWVTINSETRRLSKLPDDIRSRWLSLAPSPPRTELPPSETKKKLQDFPEDPALQGPAVHARRTDMDPNGHINNVCYLSWALDVVPERIFNGYHLREVEMDFKAECHAGDIVEAFAHPLTDLNNGNGCTQQFLHLLRKRDGNGKGTEVWRARTTWIPKVYSCR